MPAARPQKPFRLLRYLLLSVVIAVPSVTLVAFYLTDRVFRDGLLAEAGDYAHDVAENILHQIEEEVLKPALARGEVIDLPKNIDLLARLQHVVRNATHGHRVERVYCFNAAGQVIFSTEQKDIGLQVAEGYSPFEKALQGGVASGVRSEPQGQDVSDFKKEVQLLETYVPVPENRASNVHRLVKVIEVYQDMRGISKAVSRARSWVALLALACMSVLIAAFSGVSVKADRMIRAREAQILASNEALRRLSESLDHQVEQRTQQLIRAEKLAGIGTLAAGVAHEVNNPAATISVCAEGSLRRLGEGDGQPEEEDLRIAREYLRTIREEVFRVKGITGSLLEFARQGAEREDEPLDLDHLVQQTVELIRLDDRTAGVEIDLKLSAPAGAAVGRPSEIRQVLHNLLANSLDAVQGVHLPRITVKTWSANGSLHLECADNGVGFPREIEGHIFEPFVTTKPQGTGLGLSVCYAIARRHRGTIVALPPEGQAGARVRLSLPAVGGIALRVPGSVPGGFPSDVPGNVPDGARPSHPAEALGRG